MMTPSTKPSRRILLRTVAVIVGLVAVLVALVAGILAPYYFSVHIAQTSGGVLAVFGLLDLFILICVVYDTARHRRLHPAFGWGALLSFLWPALGIASGGSSSGSTFATWVLNKAH